jgi:tetratricopeptide (TPR) repeat protein
MARAWASILLLGCSCAYARQAVGLVLSASAGGSDLTPASGTVLLHARAGDLLFAGDTLKAAEDGSVTFAFCPTQVRYSLSSGALVVLGEKGFQQGKLKQLGREVFCALPDAPSGSDIRLQAAAEMLSIEGGSAADPPLDAARARQLREQLADLEEAIAAQPDNLLLLTSKAVLLTGFGQSARAREVYRAIGKMPDAPAWATAETLDAAARGFKINTRGEAAGAGDIYALLVGVSEYANLDKSAWLKYADADADLMKAYLQSARGGSVPETNIECLTNQQAKRGAIQAKLAATMARAKENDTVIVFIAAHGVALSGGAQDGAYILTNDSSFEKPEDALPMRLVQNLIEQPGGRAKQVLVFVDVCHSGTIGLLPHAARALNELAGATLEHLASAAGVFGLMSSEDKQVSFESDRFGNGHGAFTWYLLEGLNGAAAASGNAVSRESLLDYVYNAVCEATNGRQTPALRGNTELAVAIVENSLVPGMPMPAVGEIPSPKRCAAKPIPARSPAPITEIPETNVAPHEQPREITSKRIAFEGALARLARDFRQLPAARDALDALAAQLAPLDIAIERNRIRVALEAGGETVIAKYIAGEEANQTQADFERCAAVFDDALGIAPDSPMLAARADFCRGRALIFSRKYDEAIARLERAVRADPLQSYALNALGIAYLELGRFDAAIAALRDAIRLSPFWAYPRHNMALALREQGKYEEAIREYAAARERAPTRSYLAYNQGLIYQQAHQDAEAAQAYLNAIEISQGKSAKPYIAKGLLEASRRRWDEAEADYHTGLKLAEIPQDRLAARYNLALALVRKPATAASALDLWRANLAEEPTDVPTRLALGEALARQGDNGGAIEQYWAAIQITPGYVAARIELSRLREGIAIQPNALIYEALGDAEWAAGDFDKAREAYIAGAAHVANSRQRKHLLDLSKRNLAR